MLFKTFMDKFSRGMLQSQEGPVVVKRDLYHQRLALAVFVRDRRSAMA